MTQATLVDVVMPRLSDSMEEGTILAWTKKVGDPVAVGEELVEVETDKANMAYASEVAGTLTEILAEEGATVAIGEPIARIGSASDIAPPAGSGNPEVAEPAQGAETEEPADGERAKASPLARRIAQDRGVDLLRLKGSGPAGRIVKADVEQASPAAAAPAPPPGTNGAAPEAPASATAKGAVRQLQLSKLQATVSRRMSESKATAPHFYLQAEVDMSAAVAARSRLKALASEGDVVPSFNDMVIKACALALRDFPRANGAYRDGGWELYSSINVGIAVAAEDALVVPTIFNADKKGLREIASDGRLLASRVREGKITPPELSGGTFTVSNLGMYGVSSFQAVINQPQAAILAVGSIEERPAVREGELVAAQLMNVTLSADHRILYGADGAQFLARVRSLLEEPVSLAL